MGYRSANINVVDSGDQLGRTVADYGKGNVNVALEVDVQKAAPNLNRNDFMTIMPVLVSLTANWWR